MKVEQRKVKELRPHPRNSRTHTDEQVEAIAVSIREYGFNDPIAIDSDGQIIAGHGRLQAAEIAGLAEVPVVVLDHLSPEQARAYLIAHNKTSDQAGWDKDMVAAEFAELVAAGIDSRALGLTEEERQALEAPERREKGATDDDEVPSQAEVQPKAKTGQVWRLGRHVLICGDATDDVVLKRALNALEIEHVDMLWTDPPYNVDYTGGTNEHLQIENDSMARDQFQRFLTKAFEAAARVVKPGGCFYVFHASSSQREFENALDATGWLVKQQLIWVKDRFVLSRQDYNWRHEPVFFGWKRDAPAYNWQHEVFFYGWRDGAAHFFCRDFKLNTVIECPRPRVNREHPTMKPVELVEQLIENSTLPGSTVLDPFGGSGSTLIACEKAARTAVIVELDPRFCDVIVARYEAYTEEKAERVA